MFSYSVAIRTLGKAGEKYQALLDSLAKQTVQPEKIVVYIAEGYPIPQETIGVEQYVYVKKGMIAQRALQYPEMDSEYILFLDDDVYLPENGVETLYRELVENGGDVISPEVFHNERIGWKTKLARALSGRMRPRFNDEVWANKVMRNACFSYNNTPRLSVYRAQTNAGPCCFCSKEKFLAIAFEKELWLDNIPYALGEDQLMYYKMFLSGMNVLTSFDSGILHLDAGSTMRNADKEKTLAYCDFYFKTVFWKRFIYDNERFFFLKMIDAIALGYTFSLLLVSSVIKLRFDVAKVKWAGIRDGKKILKEKPWDRK